MNPFAPEGSKRRARADGIGIESEPARAGAAGCFSCGMRFFITLILPAVFAGGPLAQPGVESGKPVRVAGTRVSLVPPPNFTPSGRFTGYESEGEGAAIVVVEMPASVAEVAPALADSGALSKRGMLLLGREDVGAGGFSGLLFHYKQIALGSELLKWMLVIGDEKELVMVTASFPKESEAKLSPLLRRSVLSVRWHRGEGVVAGEGLNYRVSEGGVLKLAQRVGNTLLYTPGGVMPAKSVDDPLFVVGPSTVWGGTRDRKGFSESRVFQINEVTNIGVLETSAITVNGLDGYEILTTGKDRKTGEPVTVYQVMLFDGDGYYLMQGIVGVRNAPSHLDTFRQMARSFRRVPVAGRAGSGKP
jgi:hypothetical protein